MLHDSLPSRKLQQIGIDPRLGLPILLLAAVAVIVWLMMASGHELEPSAPEQRQLPIDAFHARVQDLQFSVHSQGSVEPRTASELVAEVSGVVSWVSPRLAAGGEFEQGEALLKLDSSDYETALIRSKAVLARSKAQQQRAESEFKRMTKLHERKLASKSQLDTAVSDYEVAQANLDEAQANVRQAKRDIKRTTLKAPYTGRVRSKQVDQGQFVSRGTGLASVYATDYVEVRLPLADSELAFLESSGQQQAGVTLKANYAGKAMQWVGHIDRMEASIDTRSRMVLAVARIDAANDAGPPVGLFVQADIAGRQASQVFKIPRAALQLDDSMLVVGEANRLELREVSVLRIEDEHLIIDSGLRDGDIVSVSISPTLAPGSLVNARIVNAQAETTALE